MVTPAVLTLAAVAGSLTPTYDTPRTKAVIEAMVGHHGGLDAWRRVSLLSYRFFTRNSGAPEPYRSRLSVP